MDGCRLRERSYARAGSLGRRQVTLLFAAALAAAALAVVGSAEAAALKVINVKYHLVSDGSRFVAFERSDGTPMILDTRKGKVRKIRSAQDCEPSDIGYRRVLLNCANAPYSDFRPSRIASVRTGKSRAIPNGTNNEEYGTGDIGRFWVRGDCQSIGGDCYWTTYTNFRMGVRRSFTTVGLPASVPDGLGYEDLDLNYRHLGRFVPHPDFTIFSDDFNWPSYIGFGAHYYLLNESGGMFLVRSPQARIRIGGFLPVTDSIYFSKILARGSGRIAWIKGKWLRAYDLRPGERILRGLPKRPTSIAMIKQGAVVAFPTRKKSGKKAVLRLRIVKF